MSNSFCLHPPYILSTVGYVVGLGDRHVENILVDCNTAEVIHIDLGTWNGGDQPL